MKKLLALLLAAVMCFSLTACGEEAEFNEPALPDGDAASNESALSAGDAGSNEPALSDEWMSYLCGEWKILLREHEDILDIVNIKEDGTIEIDGSQYTWQTNFPGGDFLACDIMDSDSKIGYFELSETGETGDIQIEMRLDGVDTNEIGDTFTLYKPAHYEIVEINPENLYDYFETKDIWEEKKNAFGELTLVKIDTWLILKEPYQARVSRLLMDDTFDGNTTDGLVIEWTYFKGGLDIVVDLDEKIYRFENFDETTKDTETGITTFTYWGQGQVGYGMRSFSIVPNEAGRYHYTWNFEYDWEINRMKGVLYLVAE